MWLDLCLRRQVDASSLLLWWMDSPDLYLQNQYVQQQLWRRLAMYMNWLECLGTPMRSGGITAHSLTIIYSSVWSRLLSIQSPKPFCHGKISWHIRVGSKYRSHQTSIFSSLCIHWSTKVPPWNLIMFCFHMHKYPLDNDWVETEGRHHNCEMGCQLECFGTSWTRWNINKT